MLLSYYSRRLTKSLPLTKVARAPRRLLSNLQFMLKFWTLRNKPKIIYALTPLPTCRNLGDHAQTIAIRAWLARHYRHLPVIELDYRRTRHLLPALRWLTGPDDILVLQSGGNMGDFRKPVETIRQLLIRTFTKNKIVSLPTTIHTDDSYQTNQQREMMIRVYQAHSKLIIFARDVVSERLAKQLLKDCHIILMPDFALSMPWNQYSHCNDTPHVLLCLRSDTESELSVEDRENIKGMLPYCSEFFDTRTEVPIASDQQEAALNGVLDTIRRFDVVVTDRFHGLIFSVMLHKACVALASVDHKMIGGYEWFRDLPFVAFAKNLEQIPTLVERCLNEDNRAVPNWNERYFDRIPKLIRQTFN